VQPKPIQLEHACATTVIDHQIAVIQVEIGKKFTNDVLIDGGYGIHIIIKNLKV
jgi:hypothetical protein